MHRVPLMLFMIATLLSVPAKPTYAQRSGELVEGLFKSLLEAHTDRERRKRLEAEERRHQHHRDNFPDTNVVPVRPTAPPVPRSGGPIVSYRNTLKAFVGQSNQLVARLQSSTNVPGVRPLFAECWNLKNRAALIYGQCNETNDPLLLSEAYCKLDCDWRNISYKLQTLGGLDQTCLAAIHQMDTYSDQMCGFLGVDPQFDRDRMLELMVQGATYIDTLVDDIEFELYDHPDCDRLVAQGRQLMQRIRGEANFIRDANYDEIVPRFNNFATRWRTYSGSLYKFRNPSIQRRLAKVRATGEQIFELLWIPASVDRGYLEHLADSMESEIKVLLSQMSVQTLVSFPPNQQQSILDSARQLQSQCGTYSSAVKQQRPIRELRQQFQEIDRHWGAISPYLQNVDSKMLARCQNAMNCHHRDMRSALGMRQQIDVQMALKLAAALEGMSEQLGADVNRFSRYYRGGDFRNRVVLSATQFHNQSKNLHFMLSKGRDFSQLQTSCNELVQSWNGLSQLIDRMPQNGLSPARFNRVDGSRRELMRIVAELAAMLTV